MKSSKAQITAKFHKIPAIRFEDQQLTSFSGLLIFQLLFKRVNLKQRLKKCFSHLDISPIFGGGGDEISISRQLVITSLFSVMSLRTLSKNHMMRQMFKTISGCWAWRLAEFVPQRGRVGIFGSGRALAFSDDRCLYFRCLFICWVLDR